MTGFDGDRPVILDVLETTPDIARKAMLTIAENSADADETKAMLVMLGLIKGEDPAPVTSPAPRCTVCDTPMYSKRSLAQPEGYVRDGGRGMCSSHYQQQLKAERQS